MSSVATNQSTPSEDLVLQFDCEIEEDVTAELEDFVRLSHLCQFQDAHELYDECLSHYNGWFPVAAEYADCLLREGDFEQLVAFSQRAASNFQDPSENMLLELMHVIGRLGIRSLSSRDVMQHLRSLWPASSLQPLFTSLMDADIHLLEILLQILVLTGRHPEDLDASLTDLTSDGPWGVFKDWFCFLLCHGYFWEAQRIFSSLLHTLTALECRDMVRDYIRKAVSANIGQESVKIAVSSLVQRFVYVVESGNSPLSVAQWNDAITGALFGITLAKAGEESPSLFNWIRLRRSLERVFEPNIHLPLDGVNEDDEIINRLIEAVMDGDEQAMRQVMISDPSRYTVDDFFIVALFKAAQCDLGDVLPFLNPRTVNARDGYHRTPLHWASLNGHKKAVDRLLIEGGSDPCLLDWFGRTPLHYAVRRCVPGSARKLLYLQIVEALLKSDSATVATKDPIGLTPLHMAIENDASDVAEILLQHGAIVQIGDYRVLPRSVGEPSKWHGLLSRYDPPQRYDYPEPVKDVSGMAASTAKLSFSAKSRSEQSRQPSDVMAIKYDQERDRPTGFEGKFPLSNQGDLRYYQDSPYNGPYHR